MSAAVPLQKILKQLIANGTAEVPLSPIVDDPAVDQVRLTIGGGQGDPLLIFTIEADGHAPVTFTAPGFRLSVAEAPPAAHPVVSTGGTAKPMPKPVKAG